MLPCWRWWRGRHRRGLSWRYSMRCWQAGNGSSRAAGSRRSSCGGASGWCAGSLCSLGAGRGAGRRGRWRRGSPLAAGRIRRSGFTRGRWGASWTTHAIPATAGQRSARPGWARGPRSCVMRTTPRSTWPIMRDARSGARCPGLNCRPCSTWLMTVSGRRRAGGARVGWRRGGTRRCSRSLTRGGCAGGRRPCSTPRTSRPTRRLHSWAVSGCCRCVGARRCGAARPGGAMWPQSCRGRWRRSRSTWPRFGPFMGRGRLRRYG